MHTLFLWFDLCLFIFVFGLVFLFVVCARVSFFYYDSNSDHPNLCPYKFVCGNSKEERNIQIYFLKIFYFPLFSSFME